MNVVRTLGRWAVELSHDLDGTAWQPDPGERIALDGIASTSGPWSRFGRLILTDRRLVFLRTKPQLWLFKPHPPKEVTLADAKSCELGPRSLRSSWPWPKSILLSISDGSVMRFQTPGAEQWLTHIRQLIGEGENRFDTPARTDVD